MICHICLSEENVKKFDKLDLCERCHQIVSERVKND